MRVAVLVLGLTVAGCGLGDGTGTLAGTLFLRGCTTIYDYGALGAPAGYDMKPSYFVADPVNALASAEPLHPINKLTVRVQPTGTRFDESDVLLITVADDAQVATGGGTQVGATTNVRATLELNQTCPDAEVQPELVGMMTWTAFGGGDVATLGLGFGDHLAASFSFDVVDQRQLSIGGIGGVPTMPAAQGHVDGSFDFIIRQGKAAQPF